MHIYFQKEPLDRLWHFVHAVKTEVGGFGYGTIIDNDTIIVDTVFPVAQYASAGEVDFIEGGGVAEAIEFCAMDGRLGQKDFIWFSWHSHNTMSAFWSGTDESCITQYADQGIKNLLSFVGNHKSEYKLRLDCFDVESQGLLIPHVWMHDLDLEHDPMDAAFDTPDEEHPWTTEVKDAIREKPKVTYHQNYGSKNYGKSGYQFGKKDREQVDKDVSNLIQDYKEEAGKAWIYVAGEGWIELYTEDDIPVENTSDANEMLEIGRLVAIGIEKKELELKDLKAGEFEAMCMYYQLVDSASKMQINKHNYFEDDPKVANDAPKELTA